MKENENLSENLKIKEELKKKNYKEKTLAIINSRDWKNMNDLGDIIFSGHFRDDRDIILAAVKKNGRALLFASEKLKEDVEIVMAAVQNDGEALNFAGSKSKDNSEIVMMATKNDILAYRFASDRLQKEFVKNNPDFFNK